MSNSEEINYQQRNNFQIKHGWTRSMYIGHFSADRIINLRW